MKNAPVSTLTLRDVLAKNPSRMAPKRLNDTHDLAGSRGSGGCAIHCVQEEMEAPPHRKRQAEDSKGGNSSQTVWWIFFSFVFYCTAGPATIFLNQYLLTSVHFPYPAALSVLGTSTSSIVAWICIALGIVNANHLQDVTPCFYATRIAPIGCALAGTLTTGNNAYLHLSIAFIQILKSLSPVILLSLLWLLRIEKPRAILGVAVGIIVIGMMTATQGELRMTWIGVILMLLSEFFDSIKAINMQILLSDKNFDSFESLAVFGPAAIVSLLIVSYCTEDYARAIAVVKAHPLLFFIASISGLGVNLATNMYIKATSALTLRITSIARNLAIVFFAAAFRRDSPVTPLEASGYLVSLTGVALYNHARSHTDATLELLAKKLNALLGAICHSANRRLTCRR